MPTRRKKKKKKRQAYRYAGQKFASKAERDFATYMDATKIPWQYEPEAFQWIPPKQKYTPDFKVQRPDGTFFFIEYKGYLRPTDRTKMREIRKQYPDLDIRIVFMNARKKLYKGSPSTYGDWATRHGYEWSELTIPDEWLQEGA